MSFRGSGRPGARVGAVFGADHTTPEKIAYLDRSTSTWTQIYDVLNSPVDFSIRLSIEVDTNDNLWVATKYNLYVLKLNDWPTWLETSELPSDKLISYPNPVKNELHILNYIYSSKTNLIVTDLYGKVVMMNSDVAEGQNIDVSNLSQGVYYLTIEEDSKTTTIRFIKN